MAWNTTGLIGGKTVTTDDKKRHTSLFFIICRGVRPSTTICTPNCLYNSLVSSHIRITVYRKSDVVYNRQYNTFTGVRIYYK